MAAKPTDLNFNFAEPAAAVPPAQVPQYQDAKQAAKAAAKLELAKMTLAHTGIAAEFGAIVSYFSYYNDIREPEKTILLCKRIQQIQDPTQIAAIAYAAGYRQPKDLPGIVANILKQAQLKVTTAAVADQMKLIGF